MLDDSNDEQVWPPEESITHQNWVESVVDFSGQVVRGTADAVISAVRVPVKLTNEAILSFIVYCDESRISQG